MNVKTITSDIYIAANVKNNIISLYDNIYNNLTQHHINGNENKRRRICEDDAVQMNHNEPDAQHLISIELKNIHTRYINFITTNITDYEKSMRDYFNIKDNYIIILNKIINTNIIDNTDVTQLLNIHNTCQCTHFILCKDLNNCKRLQQLRQKHKIVDFFFNSDYVVDIDFNETIEYTLLNSLIFVILMIVTIKAITKTSTKLFQMELFTKTNLCKCILLYQFLKTGTPIHTLRVKQIEQMNTIHTSKIMYIKISYILGLQPILKDASNEEEKEKKLYLPISKINYFCTKYKINIEDIKNIHSFFFNRYMDDNNYPNQIE